MDSQNKPTETARIEKGNEEIKQAVQTGEPSVQAGHENPGNKKSGRIPFMVIMPAVVIVVIVAVLFIFGFHAKSSVPAVSYTPITSFSSSSLSSIISGNWSLILNETANSTVINKYAGTGNFPQGTVAATIQEFVPYSEVSDIAANNSANISDFVSTVYYLNSSSAASSLLNEIKGVTGSEYSNDSKANYNVSSIGSASMVYISGRLNSSNSSTENATELYLMSGKTLVIASLSNQNIDYLQAENIVTYLFS